MREVAQSSPLIMLLEHDFWLLQRQHAREHSLTTGSGMWLGLHDNRLGATIAADKTVQGMGRCQRGGRTVWEWTEQRHDVGGELGLC